MSFIGFKNYKARERQKKRFISDHQFLNHNNNNNTGNNVYSPLLILFTDPVFLLINTSCECECIIVCFAGRRFGIGPLGTFAGYGTHHNNASMHMENSFSLGTSICQR